jgi:hypothetical protein
MLAARSGAATVPSSEDSVRFRSLSKSGVLSLLLATVHFWVPEYFSVALVFVGLLRKNDKPYDAYILTANSRFAR